MREKPDREQEKAPHTQITIITLPKAAPPRSRPLPASPSPLSPVGVPQRSATEAVLSGRRKSLIVWITFAVVLLITCVSISPIGGVVSPYLPWTASHQTLDFPTNTPGPIGGYRPVVSGVNNFICTALPLARSAQAQMIEGPHALEHPWYASVIIAQWGIEQGWTMPTYTGYNFGNVSAIRGQPAVPGTSQPGSPGAFAYAGSAEQGVADYVLFTQAVLYAGVEAAWSGGAEAQAIALGIAPWDANHYTVTGHPGSTLVSVMRQFNLQRFDQFGASC